MDLALASLAIESRGDSALQAVVEEALSQGACATGLLGALSRIDASIATGAMTLTRAEALRRRAGDLVEARFKSIAQGV